MIPNLILFPKAMIPTYKTTKFSKLKRPISDDYNAN